MVETIRSYTPDCFLFSTLFRLLLAYSAKDVSGSQSAANVCSNSKVELQLRLKKMSADAWQ